MGNIDFVQQTRADIQDAGFESADINGPDGLSDQQKNLVGLGKEVHVESITINSWEDMKKVINRVIDKGAGEYDVRFGADLKKNASLKAEIQEVLNDFGRSCDLEQLKSAIEDKVGADGMKDPGTANLEVTVSRLENLPFEDFDLDHEAVMSRMMKAKAADRKHVMVVKEEDEGVAAQAIVDALQSMARLGMPSDGMGEHFRLVVRKGDSPRPQQSSYEGMEFTPEQLSQRLLGSADDRRDALAVLAGIADRKSSQSQSAVEEEIRRLEEEAAQSAVSRREALEGELSERREEIEQQLDAADREREARLAELGQQRDEKLALAGASFRGFINRDISDADLESGYQAESAATDDSSNGFHFSVTTKA
jgi:hypothetical protein